MGCQGLAKLPNGVEKLQRRGCIGKLANVHLYTGGDRRCIRCNPNGVKQVYKVQPKWCGGIKKISVAVEAAGYRGMKW